MNNINWGHRILMPDGTYTPGVLKHGPDGGDWPDARFGLPKDLTGKTVLDIGTYDGFFAFLAEKRGGIVTAADIAEQPGFTYARKALNSEVHWMKLNLDREASGYRFHVVLCYGVLYHLKSPLSAMEHLFRSTMPGGLCLIETAITTINDVPMLEYRPGVDNDPTNYFVPNEKWVTLAAKEVGFKSCELIYTDGYARSTFKLRGKNE